MQQFFQLLRPGPEEMYVLASALGTCLRHRRGEPAVVAHHALRALMVSHGDRTISALEMVSASATQRHWRVAAPVQQHHHLLFALEALFYFFRQLARDYLLMTGLPKLLPHVDDLNLR